MQLWIYWFEAIWLLRPACSRLKTFMWFVVCVAGLTIRSDLLGVTSIIRALGIHEKYYQNLLGNFHSSGIKLSLMTTLWAKIVLRFFFNPVVVNGRLFLVGDSLKVGKGGKKMPAVKLLHQQSESNTKPEYIMGHSIQAVSLLIQASNSFLAVPLNAKIHEGIVFSNRHKRTLLDKMLALLVDININQPYYFVADAYYACQKMVKGLLKQHNHLITRAKSNAVAYEPYIHQGAKKPGRPKLYGKKIALKSLFKCKYGWEEGASPVYGEKEVTMAYQTRDLLWRPAGQLVRFVAVVHPTRGQCLLMSTDTSLSALDIIRIYGLRFKIEHAFKQAVRVLGSFSYHFWMKEMKPLRRRQGNQYLHRESPKYREKIKRKMHAYHVFIFAGIVAQGLLHYLSACHPDAVWKSFGSWLRTIRPGITPSEMVVAIALRHSYPQFLLDNVKSNKLVKFIGIRLNPDRMAPFGVASG